MDNNELCQHTRIRLIAAAIGHQQCTKTAANVIPLPGTDRFIAIGTAAEVVRLLEVAPAKVLPKDEGAVANDLPEKPYTNYNGYSDGSEPLWTAEQMEDYARAAIAAHIAAQPVAASAGIEGLTRYAPRQHSQSPTGATMESSDDGYFLHVDDVRALLATQSAKQGAQDNRTFMDDKQAYEWAWSQVKSDVGTKGWTVGEHGNYFGFFLHGWRYGKQYERQGTTAAPAAPLQTMDDTTRDEAPGASE